MLLNNLSTRSQYILAGNPLVSAATLDELSCSFDPKVRARVAEHASTSLPTLFKLLRDESAEVRQSIVFSPRRTLPLLLQLADDISVDVRYSLAENAMIPQVILQFLVDDENPYVSLRAAQTLRRVQELELTPKAA